MTTYMEYHPKFTLSIEPLCGSNMATGVWLFYLTLALILSVCPGKKKVSKEVRNFTFNVIERLSKDVAWLTDC